MDRLARELHLDPIDFRVRNAAREGDPLPNGQTWPAIGLVECLERARESELWRERGEDGAGTGVAVGGWFGGMEPAAAACRLNGDGSITVQVGSTDITGVNTTFSLIAAEEFGLDPSQVQVVQADTDSAPYAGVSGGSKTIYSVGPAIQAAVQDAKRQLLALAGERLEIAPEDLELRDGRITVRGVPDRGIDVKELAGLSMQFGGQYPPIYGHGRAAVHHRAPAFAVHVARVSIDGDTGLVRTTGLVAVQDVGRALNPAEVAGQIHGGAVQGLGRALLEALVYDDQGQLQDGTFADYALPSAPDVPAIQVELVELPSAHGPFGAKGVGEPPAVPTAGAVANAIAAVTGCSVTRLPMTPEVVLDALTQK